MVVGPTAQLEQARRPDPHSLLHGLGPLPTADAVPVHSRVGHRGPRPRLTPLGQQVPHLVRAGGRQRARRASSSSYAVGRPATRARMPVRARRGSTRPNRPPTRPSNISPGRTEVPRGSGHPLTACSWHHPNRQGQRGQLPEGVARGWPMENRMRRALVSEETGARMRVRPAPARTKSRPPRCYRSEPHEIVRVSDGLGVSKRARTPHHY
jgi:hypothetical protein